MCWVPGSWPNPPPGTTHTPVAFSSSRAYLHGGHLPPPQPPQQYSWTTSPFNRSRITRCASMNMAARRREGLRNVPCARLLTRGLRRLDCSGRQLDGGECVPGRKVQDVIACMWRGWSAETSGCAARVHCAVEAGARYVLHGIESSGKLWYDLIRREKRSKAEYRKANGRGVTEADLCCAALERREYRSNFLIVERVGNVAGLRGGNHEVRHDLAVEVGAQADGHELVTEKQCGPTRAKGKREGVAGRGTAAP